MDKQLGTISVCDKRTTIFSIRSWHLRILWVTHWSWTLMGNCTIEKTSQQDPGCPRWQKNGWYWCYLCKKQNKTCDYLQKRSWGQSGKHIENVNSLTERKREISIFRKETKNQATSVIMPLSDPGHCYDDILSVPNILAQTDFFYTKCVFN